jgi:hypothetical protein
MQEIGNLYPDYLVLRSNEDMDRYDDATEAFAGGGSRSDLMARRLSRLAARGDLPVLTLRQPER